MPTPFPFLFFGHGELDPESIDKCEEVSLWFERAPTLSERKRIVAGCPPPLQAFSWGDRFCYFGSPGDSYDALVAETWGDASYREAIAAMNAAFDQGDYSYADLPDPYEQIAKAMPAYAEALDRWVAEVHAIVPILFFFGPNGADPDDAWNRWSERNIAPAVAAVLAHQGELPWLALGEAAGDEPVPPAPEAGKPGKAPKVDKYLVATLPRSEAARYFGYIRDRVLRMGFDAADDAGKRAAIELVYGDDGVAGPVSRLSLQEHAIQHNSEMVAKYLGKSKTTARWARLAELSPWVRLAWLASYDASKAKDLLKHPDAVGLVGEALNALPPDRAAAGAGIVLMIANNLCHVSPAFAKVDKQHAGLAADLLALAIDRPEAHEEVWLHAATFAEWAGRDEQAMAVGERAARRFPTHREILSGAIATAGRLGRTEWIPQWSRQLEDLPPDHDTVLNQTFALVKASQVGKALEVVRHFLEHGGKPTAKILTNYTYTMRFADAASTTEGDLDRLEGCFAADPTLLGEMALLENAVAAMNTRGRATQSVALVERALANGHGWSPALACNTTYSAVLARDPAIARRVADLVEDARGLRPELTKAEPGTLDNLAILRALSGDLDRGFALLAEYAAARAPDLAEWRSSPDYALFRGDPRFEILLSRVG
jgi:hypothetical protein